MSTTAAPNTTSLGNIDALVEEHQDLLAVVVTESMSNGGDFTFLDEVATALAVADGVIIPDLNAIQDAGFLTLWDAEANENGTFRQIGPPTLDDHWGGPEWQEWATARLGDEAPEPDSVPKPGSPEAAMIELNRREFNKAAKKAAQKAGATIGSHLLRNEAASEWAFTAPKSALEAIVATHEG